ncbi:MAG: leucyl aminopeptidase family protein [Chitinophagales bacterium]
MILTTASSKTKHSVYLFHKKELQKIKNLSKDEFSFIDKRIKEDIKVVSLLKDGGYQIYVAIPEEKIAAKQLEKLRLLGFQVCNIINDIKIDTVKIHAENIEEDNALAFCEGLILSNYQFNKYKTGKKAFKTNTLNKIHLDGKTISKAGIEELNSNTEAVYFARDLVNEPLSYLTAVQYSKDIEAAGKKYGFKTTVWDQKKIASMKMGGVMAVNKGSVQPATFNILEYKPSKPSNKKPIVLVGKGVVYDTGGLSLKPTANSMDYMKCDMGGSAVVVGAMIAIAKNKLDVHVIGLIPAVENRPGGDAFVPGDVITMYDGTTVEVLNTDAEGRLILADALAYAKSLEPLLVCDYATLTGSAARAIGPHAIAVMGNIDDETRATINKSAQQTYERIIEFPLWDEYGEMLESTIADIQNLGGAISGAITAGKFLEHFTDYPWMHFDIAPVAYFHKTTNYRGNNGTGTGVRLTYDFIKSMSKK